MIVRSDGERNWIRVFAGVIAIWALLIGMILLEILPYTPRSLGGWAVLLISGPPIYLAVSWFGERVLSPRLARIAPARYSPAWFGWMLVVVVAGTAYVVLTAFVALRLRP